MASKRKPARYEVLAELVNLNKWRVGVELGVFQGVTFFHLLDHCPDLHLTGVDTWRPNPKARGKPGGRSYEEHDLEAFYRGISRQLIKYRGRAEIIRAFTAPSAGFFEDGSLDFVFIDADHTQEGVSADIRAWLPKIRPGGALTGHDAGSPKFPGVTEALNELLPGWTLLHSNVWLKQC